jgi:hypothetical protein
MKIENEGPRISIDDIQAIEAEIDVELSPEYRDFLLRYNGGVPTPNTVDVFGAPGTPTDVQVFFGIRRSVETNNLLWNRSLILERCPGCDVLPIACDSGGNIFCLKVERRVAAEVIYVDLDVSECKFYPVAPTFGKFISSLRPYAH